MNPTHYLWRNCKFVWFACFTKLWDPGSFFVDGFHYHLDQLTLMEGAGLGYNWYRPFAPFVSHQVIQIQLPKSVSFPSRFAATCRAGDLCSWKPKDKSYVTSAANSPGTLYTWRASCPGTSPQWECTPQRLTRNPKMPFPKGISSCPGAHYQLPSWTWGV